MVTWDDDASSIGYLQHLSECRVPIDIAEWIKRKALESAFHYR